MRHVAASSTTPAKHRGTDRRAHLWAALTVLALSAAAITLRICPPGPGTFYPACPFRALTGLLCPGCGATHALAALARGDLDQALHWNPLVTLLLPLALAYGAVGYARGVGGVAPALPRVPRAAILLLWIAALGFGVVRNL